MAFDVNSTYTMLQAIEQAYAPNTFFRDTFFPNVETFTTNYVLMDIQKGGRPLAPFVSRNGNTVNMQREGRKTNMYEPPILAPSRTINTKDVEMRGLGENIVSTKTPAERAMELRTRDLVDLQDMIVRRHEWECAQAMLFGKFDITGYAANGTAVVTDTVTYTDFTQKKTLSGADMWSNPTTATPRDVLQEAYQAISQNANLLPDYVVMNSKTATALLKCKQTQDFLLRPQVNLNLMSIAPKVLSTSVTLFGVITELGNLPIYVYDATYTDDAGTAQPFIPDGYVVMGISGRGKQLFAAITQLEGNGEFKTYASAFVPKVWDDIESNTKKLAVSSAMLPVPATYDDWYTLKVM